MEISNKTINNINETVMTSFQNRLNDPISREKTEIWYPKAQRIVTLSNIVFDYANEIKSKNRFSKEDIDDLYKKLLEFKKGVLLTDSSIFYEFKDNMIITSNSFDQEHNEQKGFYSAYFKKSSINASLAMISKIQNNVRTIENKTLFFLYNKPAIDVIIEDYTRYSAIAFLSSSFAKANDTLEVTAGLGAFSMYPKPEIFINNKKREINEMGYVSYKFKALEKPGKHYIPIKINFIDVNGKSTTITKRVEYTVEEKN